MAIHVKWCRIQNALFYICPKSLGNPTIIATHPIDMNRRPPINAYQGPECSGRGELYAPWPCYMNEAGLEWMETHETIVTGPQRCWIVRKGLERNIQIHHI